MGLFSNNKKLCPVCGSPTPRLLSTKVEGQALCSACGDKVSFMAESKKGSLTMSSLNEYLAFYDADASVRASFNADFEKQCSGLFTNKAVLCDYSKRVFKLTNMNDAFTLPADSFVRLEVRQDNDVVIELTRDALKIYDTHVIEKIEALKPEVDKYNNIHDMVDTMKGISDAREYTKAIQEGRTIDYAEKLQNDRDFERSRPNFRCTEPFNKWYMTIEIDHPWGEGFSHHDSQIFFDTQYPSIADALDKYQTEFVGYKEIAMALRKICCPDCQIIDETNQAAPGTAAPSTSSSAATSVADDLKKFKELLDDGIITQEEFDAKKKQLLGL